MTTNVSFSCDIR